MAIFNLAAGHGAGDSGAVNGARKEKDDNLRISLAVETELKKRGHTVRQYRSDDSKNCDWKSCRTWIENNSADFSVVFHRNAYNGTATGVEVWSFNADTKSTQIASELSSAIASVSGLYNRGRKGNGAAWISANARCCEPEIGFIDNSADNTKFDNSFNAIVKAVCDTLENHFGKGIIADDVIAIGTTTNYLNIRKSPVNGAVLTSMPTGSKCNIYSIENGWAYIDYNGTKGYSSIDYMTIEYIIKEETSKVESPKEEVKQIYRVRKSWDDASSQVGAYSVLDNAITKAKENKCNVYNNAGNCVFEYIKEGNNDTQISVDNKENNTAQVIENPISNDINTPIVATPTAPSSNSSQNINNSVSFFIEILTKIVNFIKTIWSKK